MCDNWGYDRLGQLTKGRAIEEMKHAERLIERIIFLDGTPAAKVGLVPKIGAKVQQQLEYDRASEHDEVRQYNDAVKLCTDSKDTGSRELFEHLIEVEERHMDFLEAQFHSIREMALPITSRNKCTNRDDTLGQFCFLCLWLTVCCACVGKIRTGLAQSA